jgi:hypothetical protein
MPVSNNALQALFAQETDEVFLVCLTIAHPSLLEPIRVVNNTEDLQRSSGLFIACAFEIELPQESGDTMPQARLTVDNVDGRIGEAVRVLNSPPKVTLEVVMASQPDTIESGPHDLILNSVSIDVQAVSGTLGYEVLLDEPFPKDMFTPSNSPGLFA